MAKFRFAFLLELAIDEREEAARSMQAAQAAIVSATQKLEQVEVFRGEYRNRLMASGQGGMTVTQYRDFQQFLGKLDGAATAQQGEIVRLEQVYTQQKQAWLECEKKVKAFEALKVRHDQDELKRESQREQKLIDEFNSRPRER
ncbi:MAG TPA: flagellar export protein FliJ [Chitinolyticbacter sp.]|uniref:flagellar export protein FliJ n=1 Tax=Chitinolyticbacter albus TaxID=2961951 RepID=UPI0021087277|nr:flagellar export protein FliJ [Chitinolyticbacter albus]HSC79189.1 flagellar export protein FliJ [Chitinolyticbacter sp.]